MLFLLAIRGGSLPWLAHHFSKTEQNTICSGCKIAKNKWFLYNHICLSTKLRMLIWLHLLNHLQVQETIGKNTENISTCIWHYKKWKWNTLCYVLKKINFFTYTKTNYLSHGLFLILDCLQNKPHKQRYSNGLTTANYNVVYFQ